MRHGPFRPLDHRSGTGYAYAGCMPREMSEGAARAYAAGRAERIKTLAGGLLVASGLALASFNYYVWGHRALGYVLAAIALLASAMIYRTTVLRKLVQQGPRTPRRLRLPFDSHVEIASAQIPVQQRTEHVAADKKPPSTDP